MSKPNKQRFKLSVIRSQHEEAVGGTTVTAVLNNEEEVEFQHPVFADKEWAARIDEAENQDDKVRAILGDEQYEKLLEAGNDAADILFLFGAVQREAQGKFQTVRPIRY